MIKLDRTLKPEAFTDMPKLDMNVIVTWSHTWNRIEVNLCGLDVYLLLEETALEGLEKEYGVPEFEGDDIDVPSYHELQE
jgi:hypothetical protein